MVHNENRAICQECNGACCKRFSGIFYAGDFRRIEFDPETMVVDVSWRYRGGNIYYVRPRGLTESQTERFSNQYRVGTCVFL